jgi:17beta-estradiol 17-dehydrogenase / very-long-chain 3-oxoacyl-CoA reductase
MQVYVLILTLIGAIWMSLFMWKILRFIWIFFIRRSSISRYHHNHSNSSAPPCKSYFALDFTTSCEPKRSLVLETYLWSLPALLLLKRLSEAHSNLHIGAIITGASDGIGKNYAYELARRDFNIVLHGRNATKLHHVRTELHNEFPHLSFRVIIADASKTSPESLKHIQEMVDSLRDLHVTILINNVGSGAKRNGSVYTEVQDIDAEDIDHLINLNARFPAQFTRAVVPLLLTHGGPALILTMGSMSEFGVPYLSVYSASKCFDMSFSRAIRREMMAEGRNIEVLGIMTGEVTGVTHNRSQGTLMKPDSSLFAKSALDKVGCGEDVVGATAVQGIIWALVSMMPLSLLDKSLAKGVREDMNRKAKKV